MTNKKVWQQCKEYALLVFGTVLLTVGVYFFKIPNGFSTGGVSGIGTILGRLAPVLSSATWIALINLLLLLVGFSFLGKETGIRTVVCSLLFSGMTWLLEKLVPLSGPLTDQPFLELMYAMLLTAFGSAIIFNCQASSGGTDIVALILKKYSKMDVGKALFCSDSLIAASSFFVFGVRTGLFSVLGLFIKAFLVDGIIETINSSKYFTVITDHPEEITAYIIQNLHRGATTNTAIGAYTQCQRTMIHTVCNRIQAVHLREYIRQVDPHAFVVVTTTNEIIGRGFRGV